MVALELDALQAKYSGLSGRFCNRVTVQTGAPADGKSVALWVDVQILKYFDQIRTEVLLRAWKKAAREYKLAMEKPATPEGDDAAAEGAEELEDPGPEPDHKDSTYNKGTLLGRPQLAFTCFGLYKRPKKAKK